MRGISVSFRPIVFLYFNAIGIVTYSYVYALNNFTEEPIAKLCGNVAQSPSAVFNLLYFQCFLHDLPSRGRLGYSFAIGSEGIIFMILSVFLQQVFAP